MRNLRMRDAELRRDKMLPILTQTFKEIEQSFIVRVFANTLRVLRDVKDPGSPYCIEVTEF